MTKIIWEHWVPHSKCWKIWSRSPNPNMPSTWPQIIFKKFYVALQKIETRFNVEFLYFRRNVAVHFLVSYVCPNTYYACYFEFSLLKLVSIAYCNWEFLNLDLSEGIMVSGLPCLVSFRTNQEKSWLASGMQMVLHVWSTLSLLVHRSTNIYLEFLGLPIQIKCKGYTLHGSILTRCLLQV